MLAAHELARLCECLGVSTEARAAVIDSIRSSPPARRVCPQCSRERIRTLPEPQEPRVVCEVRVTKLDLGRWARFPVAFVRWRPDRSVDDCTLDQLSS